MMSARRTSNSTPVDPSKLNNTPAALPPSPDNGHSDNDSPPLRSPSDMNGGVMMDSASGYLDPVAETPSHPTVAETGVLANDHGPGPATGQLQRRESQPGRRIVRLASFGGEGLVAKPPPPGPLDSADEQAIADDAEEPAGPLPA